ncbi:MAG: Rne/Rng family ribonuclease [Alphaproteobacteria bacterium]|nr:Rne/Rng family ribonuclease [Alphaproteobacteria bacterium]
MTKRMLIDATHAEETRVVVVNGNRLEEFDFETSTKKQLKGNIYLAKVTRVEPSLQAAFVDFGGNRHGFLAFNEIHPDYYQIPVADRMALLKEEEELAAEAIAAGEGVDDDEDEGEGPEQETEGPNGADAAPGDRDAPDQTGGEDETAEAIDGDGLGESAQADGDAEGAAVLEELGGDEEEEVERPQRRRARPKRQRYKIQEVIKRRQIILVQVVKEERGNKGAALTTYLSLAGRYCVLMPNTTKGGGISRKITSPKDRKRLKSFIADLDIPDGVAVILRTAATERSKAEIRRDFEYLIRTWHQVRDTTLQSIAPTLVYEEGNLIKRSIRDLYSKDMDEVLVEGEDGYKTAKDFMRMLMPSHAKKVQPYKDDSIPLFQRYQVEANIDAMHSAEVQLKSGGYIVINPTEALVAIDVNSGRATRERNIEETAYKTNLEAAEEIARQLRLRDLAGLIVIDFIDMMDHRNQNTVERRLKEAMRADRARIQVGRISPFGLLELSRQRLRPSLIEASSAKCPYCEGTGLIRSTESAALHVLRAVEEEGVRRRSAELRVTVATPVALYMLNEKRDMLTSIENRHGVRVLVSGDDSLVPPDYRLERSSEKPAAERVSEDAEKSEETAEEKPARRRRSRRRRGRQEETTEETVEAGSADEPAAAAQGEPSEAEDETAAVEAQSPEAGEEETAAKPRRRRRGRRGGRRHGRKKAAEASEPAESETAASQGAEDKAADTDNAQETPAEPAEDGAEAAGAEEDSSAPKRRGRRGRGGSSSRGRRGQKRASDAKAPEDQQNDGDSKVENGESTAKPRRRSRAKSRETADAEPDVEAPAPSSGNGAETPAQPADGDGASRQEDAQIATVPEEGDDAKTPSGSRRKGWWNRLTQP